MKFPCLLSMCVFAAATIAGQPFALAGDVVWSVRHPSAITVFKDESAVIENHQYLHTRCYKPQSKALQHLVISLKSKAHRGPWEGSDPSLAATAFMIDKNGTAQELWQLTEKAEEGFVSCDFFRTVWYGCCTMEPNNRLYDIRTGRLMNEYSRDLLRIHIPNTPIRRYIGYKAAETIHHHPWEADKRHIGTLTYSSGDRILHRLVIRRRGAAYTDKLGSGAAKLTFIPGTTSQQLNNRTSLDLWEANGSPEPSRITGFKIQLVFYDISIQIPVVKDDFHIDKNDARDFVFVRLQ